MSFSISPKSTSHSLPTTASTPDTYSYAYSDSDSKSYSPYMPSSPKMTPSYWPLSRSGSGSSKSLLPGPNASPRRTARRVSYTLKNRISQYSLPLGLGLFVTSLFLYLTYSNGSYMPSMRLFERNTDQKTYNTNGFIREESFNSNNGLSFLDLEEDELIAEDDLFWDAYKEKQAKSKAEQKEQEQMEERRQDVIKTNKVHSLRALIWWISQGGVFPNGWEVPKKEAVLKMGPSGMEALLEGLEAGVVGDEIFQEGWADFAKDRYRVVMFSKTYCPYSKNAKKILEGYRITPTPYIIELDKRTDFTLIQTLLQYLTSRRTVPNILLDFVSIGGSDDLTLVHGEGGLQRDFQEMGLLPGWHWKAKPLANVLKDETAPINLEDLDDNVPEELRRVVEAGGRGRKGKEMGDHAVPDTDVDVVAEGDVVVEGVDYKD